jgi:hypothetical protein
MQIALELFFESKFKKRTMEALIGYSVADFNPKQQWG